MQIVQHRPHPTPDPVPRHRVSHGTWDRERDTCVRGVGVVPGDQPDRPSTVTNTLGTEPGERLTAGEPADHADRRARPL